MPKHEHGVETCKEKQGLAKALTLETLFRMDVAMSSPLVPDHLVVM